MKIKGVQESAWLIVGTQEVKGMNVNCFRSRVTLCNESDTEQYLLNPICNFPLSTLKNVYVDINNSLHGRSLN